MPPLTLGEKITVIKRCAQSLSDESWSDIDLTLRTFKLPWDSDWWLENNRGGSYDYVVEQLAQNGDDDRLSELHAYLFPDAEIDTATENLGLWRDRHFRLFLSHHHEHRLVAGEIRNTLTRFAVDTFVAHDIIEPSREWQDAIEQSLKSCDAFAALCSMEFVQSNWCDQEVGFCLARGVPIVPIRFGSLPHGFMGKFQALPGAEGISAGWTIAMNLFRTLATHQLLTEKMTWPIVQRYVNSPSYDGTREAFDLLKTIPAERWTDEMAQAVEEDAPGNRQVSEAFPLNDQRSMPQAVTEYLNDLLDRDPPADVSDFDPSAAGASDDDIPF